MKIKGIDSSVYIFGLKDESGNTRPGLVKYGKLKNVRCDGWNNEGYMDAYKGSFVAVRSDFRATGEAWEGTSCGGSKKSWIFSESDFVYLVDSPKELLARATPEEAVHLAAQLGIKFTPKTVKASGAVASTADSLAPQKGKIMTIATTLLEANKAAAAQETKRQLGKVILGQLESRLAANVPESVRPLFATPVGKYVLANVGVGLASMYTGAQQDKLLVVQEALMAAAASEIGDSLNINGLIDGVIESMGPAKVLETAKTAGGK